MLEGSEQGELARFSCGTEPRLGPDFASSALGRDAVDTHFFLTAGDVKYQVNGQGNYRIKVLDHRKVEKSEYARRSAEAPLVSIRKGKAVPEQLEIVAGQTVIWTVEEDSGVTITSVT